MGQVFDLELDEPSHSGSVPLEQVAVRLNPADNVAIVKTNLYPGTTLVLHSNADAQSQVPVRQLIPSGHKMALGEIPLGEPIYRYGCVIGYAATAIRPGQHVHTHNLETKNRDQDYAFGADAKPVNYVPEAQRRTFLGFKREDGRVGTRNYVAVVPSSNCASHVCLEIAHHFTPERLAEYANIDGVIPLAHSWGCGGGPDYAMIGRTLAGMARHPNVAAYILVGLGCEGNQAASMVEEQGLALSGQGAGARQPTVLVIQQVGGIRKTVRAGIDAVEALLPSANAVQRTPEPVSELMLALECGGSDSWSGVTANPLVGLVADEIVRQGGTVVLSETTEIYGAEHLLARRALNPEVGQKLLAKLRWWEEYMRCMGLEFDNNPGPGNKAGGLTNIIEKSLGAIAKSGSSPLTAVYEYAESVAARGFVVMDSPGYDPVSVTGKVAGGCNLVLFTTGRGSVLGFKPTPSIKICSNSTTFERLIDDMDFDAGKVLQEGLNMDTVATELLALVTAVASGQATKSEKQNVGEVAFSPWNPRGVI